MARKIRCVYIDGLDKSGKVSIFREIRKYLKENNFHLHEINGIDDNNLKSQSVLLEADRFSLILKQNSILSSLQEEIKKGSNILSITDNYRELLRKEQDINHRYGCVHFFLIPENTPASTEKFKKLPNLPQILDCYNFFKNINNYSFSQGLDIQLISFQEGDNFFDIRDKIIQNLEKNYKL